MITKLKTKFIIINMSIVTVILGIIFVLIFSSFHRNMERGSKDMLERIARSPYHTLPPKMNRDELKLPYISILLNQDNKISKTHSNFIDKTEELHIRKYVQQQEDSNQSNKTHTSDNSKKKYGILKDHNMRYICMDTPDGRCYVFVDTTTEKTFLHNMLKIFLLIGVCAFIVFLIISIFLSRWAIKPVEKAWQQQKQFIADASHELKTPLTVITTDAELIHAPTCSYDEQKQLSNNILTMSKQMRGLVEKMLELARIDATDIRTCTSIIDFSDLVNNSAMIYEPLFFEKGMHLSYEIDSDILIQGNKEQLDRLTDIILDNALKYSKEKSTVKLTLHSEKKHCKKYMPNSICKCFLSISNEGIPLSEDELSNIFKRFYRVDEARKMNHSYGLGLSIAQSIVNQHNGNIWADSKNGFNTFYVELNTKHDATSNQRKSHKMKIKKPLKLIPIFKIYKNKSNSTIIE